MQSQQATPVSERTLPFKIALAGFGTVGQSVARMLCSEEWPELRLTHIYNRNVERKKVDWIPSSVKWTDRIGDIFSSNADIFVELIGNLLNWHRFQVQKRTNLLLFDWLRHVDKLY